MILAIGLVEFKPFEAIATGKYSRKIVVFNEEIKDIVVKDNLVKKYGGKKIKDLSLINGIVIFANQDQINKMEKEHIIKRIDNDDIISVNGKIKPTKPSLNTQPPQELPWGIKKIGADLSSLISTGNQIRVAIIDSGIDLSHPDLKSNIQTGYNTLTNKEIPNDDYGHGTHVAGIVAATNNSFGVVGVGSEINLYSVKILDSTGSGYLSDLVEAIDWSINNNMQILNMSFSLSDSTILYDAIKKAYHANIILVAASGNDPSLSVSYPAAYPEVISVSAIDQNSQIASFSSSGKVDFTAPGVNIYSTYKNSTYTTISGTSSATPHVTGTIALLLTMPSISDSNNDGIVTQEEVIQRLQNTSSDLGDVGWDAKYGYGLINANSALTN